MDWSQTFLNHLSVHLRLESGIWDLEFEIWNNLVILLRTSWCFSGEWEYQAFQNCTFRCSFHFWSVVSLKGISNSPMFLSLKTLLKMSFLIGFKTFQSKLNTLFEKKALNYRPNCTINDQFIYVWNLEFGIWNLRSGIIYLYFVSKKQIESKMNT